MRGKRKALAALKTRWTNAIVPYEITSGFSEFSVVIFWSRVMLVYEKPIIYIHF